MNLKRNKNVFYYIHVFMCRSGTCTYTWQVIHFTLVMSLKLFKWKWDKEILYVMLHKFIYEN
jgi:hypothetical protein